MQVFNMAWNEASLVLLPLDWKMSLEDIADAKTVSGRTVQLLIPVQVGNSHPLSLSVVLDWLHDHGYEFVSRTEDVVRFQLSDLIVIVQYAQPESRVVSVEFRFRISPRANLRLEFWTTCLTSLPPEWGLQIFDSDRKINIDADTIHQLIFASKAWQSFVHNFQ